MGYLAPCIPRVQEEAPVRRWTEAYAAGFVLLLITYVNCVKIVPNWLEHKAIPEIMYGLPPLYWFNFGYGFLALAVLYLLARHLKERIPVIPESDLAKGQLLYLVFLWWCVVYNLMHAIPPLAEQRLVTEGVIHLNAVIVTVLILIWPRAKAVPDTPPDQVNLSTVSSAVAKGLLGAAISITLYFGVTRLLWGDQHAGYSSLHTRFGENATALQKPEKGKNHP
jgi:hypothetical protein